MSSSFELFVLYVQELMRRRVIGNTEKSIITDLFWTRFSEQTKIKYRDSAKLRNSKRKQEKCQLQKSTAFWIFAGRLMEKLQRDYIPTEYIDKLYSDLSCENKLFFTFLNDSTVNTRRNLLYTCIFDEASFLL